MRSMRFMRLWDLWDFWDLKKNITLIFSPKIIIETQKCKETTSKAQTISMNKLMEMWSEKKLSMKVKAKNKNKLILKMETKSKFL